MRVSELAKELNTTSDAILAKLRAFKLKAKDSEQELNSFVLSVLRREISKEVKIPPRPSVEKISAAVSKDAKEVKEVN